MMSITTKAAVLLFVASTAACSGNMGALLGTPDTRLYVGGIAQPEGPVAIGRTYSFRFVEKWRISHAWLQGTGVRPCWYPLNVLKIVPGYPAFANDREAPMFERDGKIYVANTYEKKYSGRIVFSELRYQVIGVAPDGFRSTGYTPFCGQFFMSSRNGMGLWILKPDPAKGTDLWIDGATPTRINGLTWLVKKVPPKDLSSTGDMAKPIEYWTLRIPNTPYWLHMQFSASQNHSVQQHPAEHEVLLGLFHQLVQSVTLDPITPVDPSAMPPFVLMSQ